MTRTHARFGYAVLIDCHSMPASIRVGDSGVRPDFIVGDRFGASAAPALTETAIGLLIAMGYTVAHNKPYAGGFITEHYGRPARGLHALQIEVNRGLYMNERTLQKSSGFDALADDLARFSAELMAMPDYHFLDAAAGRRVDSADHGSVTAAVKKDRIVYRRGRSLGRKRPRRAWTGEPVRLTDYCAMHKCQQFLKAFLSHTDVANAAKAHDSACCISLHATIGRRSWRFRPSSSGASQRAAAAETLPRFRQSGDVANKLAGGSIRSPRPTARPSRRSAR